MAYITDAAREYAKKMRVKDAKHSFEEVEQFISYYAPHPEFDPEKIEAFQKNGRDYIRVVTDKVELTFAVDYDENSKIQHLSVHDLTRKNLDTGKIDHPASENTTLSGIFGLLITDEDADELRKEIRQLVIDRDKALMTMYDAYKGFMSKWEDRFEDICRQYGLGYPGAFNNYLIDLHDLEDILEHQIKPFSKEEIDERVDELLDR